MLEFGSRTDFDDPKHGEYDLVVICSPTWWLTTCMPVRSYLRAPPAKSVLHGTPFAAASVSRRYDEGNLGDIRALGEGAGGTWAGGTRFVWTEARSCRWRPGSSSCATTSRGAATSALPLPRPNLKADYAEQAKRYAHELADSLGAAVVS